MRKMTLLAAALAVAGLTAAVQVDGAAAQDSWPSRTVTVVVPVNAGGGADPLARVIFDNLSKKLGQSFVVDFRPGASMMIGANAVAKARPDGYLIMFSASTAIVNASHNPNVPYDPVKDLMPVIRTAGAANFITANINTPYNTFDEMVAYAKANPGKINGGVSGIGGGAHAAMAKIQASTGIKFNMVPYSGAGGIVPDLLSGAVDVTFGFSAAYISGVKSGKLKYIAAMAPKRISLQPEVPSTDESAYKGVFSEGWYIVSVPKGTPPAIIKKLHDGIYDVMKTPEVEKKINEFGYEVIGDTPEQAAVAIKEEIEEMRGWIAAGTFQIQ